MTSPSQGENGTRVEEICRQMGISQTTYFAWQKKYGSLGVAEMRRRVHTLLRREGYVINQKRTWRIYQEQGFNLHRRRPKRRVSPSHRVCLTEVTQLNERWAMDFVADELFDGIRIRVLTVVDEHSRECLAITVGQGLTSKNVVTTLRRCRHEKGGAKEDQNGQRSGVHFAAL